MQPQWLSAAMSSRSHACIARGHSDYEADIMRGRVLQTGMSLPLPPQVLLLLLTMAVSCALYSQVMLDPLQLMGHCHATHRPVKRQPSHVTHHTSHITRHTSHITRHTSHVTHHNTSHATQYSSYVTRLIDLMTCSGYTGCWTARAVACRRTSRRREGRSA
jgi:hypothetical protein